VLNHAKLAAGEAVELLARGGSPRRLTSVTVEFDENNLRVVVHHSGEPLVIAPLAPAAPGGEADEAAFVEAASAAILTRLTDRLTSGTRDGASYLLLHFEH
jgi:hypothetical protein